MVQRRKVVASQTHSKDLQESPIHNKDNPNLKSTQKVIILQLSQKRYSINFFIPEEMGFKPVS